MEAEGSLHNIEIRGQGAPSRAKVLLNLIRLPTRMRHFATPPWLSPTGGVVRKSHASVPWVRQGMAYFACAWPLAAPGIGLRVRAHAQKRGPALVGLLEDRSPNVTQSTAGLGADDVGAAGRWPGRARPGRAQRCPILEGPRGSLPGPGPGRAQPGRAQPGWAHPGRDRWLGQARPCPAQPRLYLGVGAQI